MGHNYQPNEVMMEKHRRTLFSRSDEGGSVSVTATLQENGSIELFDHDIGENARRMFGRDDREYVTTVPADETGKLALALIAESYADDSRATVKLRELCEKNGIRFSVFTN
ncbi:MAG: hypothetical protein DI637_04360 [Citromicrobium sp.]|nr:MAG: hypothetical protein DI637_04360 [Citromicrobium sp.]